MIFIYVKDIEGNDMMLNLQHVKSVKLINEKCQTVYFSNGDLLNTITDVFSEIEALDDLNAFAAPGGRG